MEDGKDKKLVPQCDSAYLTGENEDDFNNQVDDTINLLIQHFHHSITMHLGIIYLRMYVK